MTTGPAPLALGLASQGAIKNHTHVGAVLGLVGIPFMAAMMRHRYIDTRTHARLSVDTGVTHVSRLMVLQAIDDPGDGVKALVWVPMIQGDVRDRNPLSGLIAGLRVLRARLRGDRSGTARLAAGVPSHFTRLEESEAHRALRLLLPLLNESGAGRVMVEEANAHLTGRNVSTQRVLFGSPRSWDQSTRSELASVNKPRRLALEMLVHEDSERRWLAGELLELILEWRRANEIAEIADGLLRDPAVESSLTALKARAAE